MARTGEQAPSPSWRLRPGEAAWGALVLPGFGLVALAAWILAHGVRLCWPVSGTDLGACSLLISAGLLCWFVAGAALTVSLRQWLRTWRTVSALLRRSRAPDQRLSRLSSAAGLDGAVMMADDLQVWALTYGLMRPRVAVSRGLCDQLDDRELLAVLLHEACHRRCYEPLRLLLARSARAVLPVAGRLYGSYVAASELAADAHALERLGPHALAGALWKLRASPLAEPVSFAGESGLLRQRVAQIAAYPGTLPNPVPVWPHVAVVLGCFAVCASWALLCLRA